ncbi:MAG TPA: Maf family protein, partial [Acetobacteraceae bacterium]|nr:Maf family protein [Acetobacteraceae bacterium]
MMQNPTPLIVLASASIARQALLTAAGVAFTTEPGRVDEDAVKQSARAGNATAEDAALLLAELKAARVAGRRPEALVIGADQILVCDGNWFDKPADLAAARAQLLLLRGRTHVLATAVLCQRGDQRIWHHIAQPRLTMRVFSDSFVDGYLAAEGDRVLGSVGAYRLESLGVHLFDRIEGDHSAILGLPMLPLLGFLRQHGVIT